MTTLDQVRQIAADVFAVSPDSLPDDASPETVADWDSVQTLNLILALEEKFDVQIDPDDLSETPTLAGIAEKLDGKRGA